MSRAVKLSQLSPELRRRVKNLTARAKRGTVTDKRGKPMTPQQIINRAKWEKQQEEAARIRAEFKRYCVENGLPIPATEFYFAEPRRWRFDYAFTEERIALEVEGGAWSGGRHTRGSGYLGDMEKYNEATLRGWTLLRTVPKKLQTPETVEMLRRAMRAREAA